MFKGELDGGFIRPLMNKIEANNPRWRYLPQVAQNPKHEIRNSKQYQMTKFGMFQTGQVRNFEFWKFEFVSDFDIRISDFS